MVLVNRCVKVSYRVIARPEWWSGVTCVLWAKWVYWQPTDLGDSQPDWILSGLLSDKGWEMTGAVIGLAQMAVLVWNRRWPRFIMAWLAATFWCVLAYGLWLANPSLPGAAAYLGFALPNISLAMLLACPRR